MKNLLFVAAMAAGLVAVMPQPANAGGHEWWRGCGGLAYEGCDGRGHGPYARSHRGGYGGGYERGGSSITVEQFHRRTHIRERTRTYFRIRIYE